MKRNGQSILEGSAKKKLKVDSHAESQAPLGRLFVISPDLLQEIAKYLSFKDLINFLRLTNRRLHGVKVAQEACLNIRRLDEKHTVGSLAKIYHAVLYLKISHQPLLSDSLAHTALGGLRVLDLTDIGISDQHLPQVADLKGLERLYLGDNPLTDSGVAHLSPLTNLKALSLERCQRITDASWSVLGSFKNLEELDLSGTIIKGQEAPSNINFSELTDLNLSCTNATDAVLSVFKQSRNLMHLNLNATQTTNEDLATMVSSSRNLESLHLKKTQVTDSGLACLLVCGKLKELSLPRQISDHGLVHVGQLTSLLSLAFWCNSLTSNGLAYLSALVNLQMLDLSYCRAINDEGLKHLESLTCLQQLHISGVAISDDVLALFLSTHPAINCLNRGNETSLLSRHAINEFITSYESKRDEGLEHGSRPRPSVF